MSNPHLPPETLNYIVDTLHNERTTLQNYCLVVKSWVPRSRKHLFAHVGFAYPRDLELWEQTFSDPSNSPAYYTRTPCWLAALTFSRWQMQKRDGWIQTFSHVVRLCVDSSGRNPNNSDISRPVPWALTCPQVPQRVFYRPFTHSAFRSRSFPTPSRRPNIGRPRIPRYPWVCAIPRVGTYRTVFVLENSRCHGFRRTTFNG